MSILDYNHFYLVGVKGVAMTSLAQCLLDAGKQVSGSDVDGDFVTHAVLERRGVHIDSGFEQPLPASTDCVIYTAAHNGPDNPQVLTAVNQGIPTVSHAEALADLFNQKHGIAVCGVGGKSTTSAMIAWILEYSPQRPSFAVGVGDIIGLHKTGQWLADGEFFVAEADEYVTDPAAVKKGQPITPRFHYMQPLVTVCTNLRFDHPDVYRDFDHTQSVFTEFFGQIKPNGVLVINADDQALTEVSHRLTSMPLPSILSFGTSPNATVQLLDYQPTAGSTTSTFTYQGQTYSLSLGIPGRFNVMNALAAVTAAIAIGIETGVILKALSTFQSTTRRSQKIGDKHGVLYYDDYAHHPDEISQVIAAFKEWYPQQQLVVAFQPHTFSRTKALFDQFAAAFAQADEVLLLDIFASARENYDPSITSDDVCQAINQIAGRDKAHNLKTITNLADYLSSTLQPGMVCLTIGAGDIYEVHERIGNGATIVS